MARGVRFQPSDDGEAKNKTATPRTQNNATNSYYFGTAMGYDIKGNACLAIPFFACPSPSLSLSLSSEEDENKEGTSVDAERVA